jgi:hypothetical protein
MQLDGSNRLNPSVFVGQRPMGVMLRTDVDRKWSDDARLRSGLWSD